MRLEHSFEVPVPVAQAWTVLLDIERIAPCMPGATLTSFDGTEFAGTVKVKLGPVNLTYRGKGRFVERDEAARQVVLAAAGQDPRGGGASARITATLGAGGGSDVTQVTVVADLDIAGRAAQFGRGMIADVSAKLIGQFADCLARTLAATVPGPAQPLPAETPLVSLPPLPAQAQPVPSVPAQTAPIDLLAVSGVKGAVRRYAPYLILAALLVVALIALIAM
jgi:uncharacterized protein